ncbi:hypothetical protein LZ554_001945 [Drepanopeziza brunnea f. sp. 'monogermtubi']|nr:hypothetical protein LZ554_001945 [Drepanopeziza brunnea f. sp. 'monogermtubi']
MTPIHSNPSQSTRASSYTNPIDALFEEDDTNGSDSETPLFHDSANNPFGSPPVMERAGSEFMRPQTREQQGQQRLMKLVADHDESQRVHSKTRSSREDTALVGLRKELEGLLMRELGEVNWEEKARIRGQRSELIQKIARIESGDQHKKVRRLKATSDSTGGALPEPISPKEKKTLMLQAENLAKARAGIEVSPLKRAREDDDHDLDGEERLRLGRPVKKRAITHTTGHWKASIHDYFPDADGDGKVGKLDGVSLEEKKTLRRELAEYAANLAKAERKKKSLVK